MMSVTLPRITRAVAKDGTIYRRASDKWLVTSGSKQATKHQPQPSGARRTAEGSPKGSLGGANQTTPVSPALARILRPQAATRWLLPSVRGMTHERLEAILRGALAGNHVQAWELFDLMEDTWPRLRKNALELKNAVCGLQPVFEPWREEEAAPDPRAEERMRVVSAALRGMRIDAAADENALRGTLFDLLDAWLKGVSVLEIEWQLRRSRALSSLTAPRATFWVHPACYGWRQDGRLGLASLKSASTPPAEFPPDKFLIALSRTKSGSPLGGALLRPLAWWWAAANFSGDWLIRLAECFGIPFRWATYSPGAPDETVDAICATLQNFGSNGWAAYPAGTTLDFKTDGLKNGSDTPQGDLLDRAEKQCDLLILGQTLTTDSGRTGHNGGSLALGRVHEGVKAEIVRAAADFVAEIIQTQLVPAVLRLNFGDEEFCPTFRLADDRDEDLTAGAEIIRTLSSAGAGSIVGLDWLGKKFGIPKPAAGEKTLAQPESQEPNHKSQMAPHPEPATEEGDVAEGTALLEVPNTRV